MSGEKELSTREIAAIQNIFTNTLRGELKGRTGSGSDIWSLLWDTFGYRKELCYDDFANIYKRQGIGKRVIDATVDFTWKDFPIIIDDESVKNVKRVKRGMSLKELKAQAHKRKVNNVRRKRDICLNIADIAGAKRYNDLMQELESPNINYTEFENDVFRLQDEFKLLSLIKRADILNNIGRYSCIVIGTKAKGNELDTIGDSKLNDMENELPQGTGIDDIAFLSVYSEKQIKIDTWNTNRTSPRYGMPERYRVEVNGDEGGGTQNFTVHYTRVIHIAEDRIDSEVYGTPRLEPIFNDLQDLLKVVGGSAEMFWLGAYQGIVFNVKDGYTLDEKSRDAMNEEIENYVNKLQRFMKTKGVEVSTLSSSVASPQGNFDVIVKLISGTSNVPIRILLGAENGVYAGNTDQDTFFSYITSRRNGFIEEDILKPLFDRLKDNGYIAQPQGGEYYLKWPELFEQTQTEKLDNATKLITAAKQVDSFGNTLKVITVEEARTALGLDPEIPETQYDEYSEFDDAAYEDELSSLPTEDDTQPTETMTALEIYKQRKANAKSKVSN